MANYSPEVIKFLLDQGGIIIVVLKDNSVHVGTLATGYGTHYKINPPNIHEGGMGFARSFIKQIILFNGLIFPKEMEGPHKHIDIIELSDLINKAGYEFI